MAAATQSEEQTKAARSASVKLRSQLTPDEKLAGDMLMFSTGLMVFASMLWLAVYWSMGQQFSTLIPLVFQLISALTMTLYLKTRKLQLFCLL